MKTNILFFLPFLWIWMSCSDSDADTASLQVSPTEFKSIRAEGEVLNASITCSSEWKVVSNQNWCIPSLTNGKGNSGLQLVVHPNPTSEERKAIISVMATKAHTTIQVIQKPYTNEQPLKESHYQLPVIFHVLYNNQNDRNQYIDKGRLAQILTICNNAYQNKKLQGHNTQISPDMNLEFILATHKPDGTVLEEPGVERISWPTLPMSCEHFMKGSDDAQNQAAQYAQLLWNPKAYINIFVYPFQEQEILGISHMPHVTSDHPLTGLYASNYYLTRNVLYPHCISLNSTYIYINGTKDVYFSTDVYNTLIHELGHYLGLLHVFSEENGNTNLCKDTDYCTDTPTYNYDEYQNYLLSIKDKIQTTPFNKLCERRNCVGRTYIAYNYMDYSFCYSNQFTPQQRNRIRHVLSYGVLIPGPKKYATSQTRSLPNEQRPPVQIIK